MQNTNQIDVKICGLKTAEAIDAALDGGASHIGFIFFAKSPRNIDPHHAAGLRKSAKGRASVVAVTVDADFATLDEIVDKVAPDMLQLHGSESPDRVRAIAARYGLAIMKAFAIRSAEDLAKTTTYQGIVDRFLFDAKPPKGSDLPGGNGVSFDWSLLQKFDAPVPVMLSGGLERSNIIEAITTARPDGVDISSGVETSPGVKNIDLISNFMQELKQNSV